MFNEIGAIPTTDEQDTAPGYLQFRSFLPARPAGALGRSDDAIEAPSLANWDCHEETSVLRFASHFPSYCSC